MRAVGSCEAGVPVAFPAPQASLMLQLHPAHQPPCPPPYTLQTAAHPLAHMARFVTPSSRRAYLPVE
jgi:hypothetical protein